MSDDPFVELLYLLEGHVGQHPHYDEEVKVLAKLVYNDMRAAERHNGFNGRLVGRLLQDLGDETVEVEA